MGYDEGGLKTVDWKADPARRAVLHGAYVLPDAFSIAILGSMKKENVESYLTALKSLTPRDLFLSFLSA